MAGRCIIIMGVSGTGKSTVGLALSRALEAKFIDGDDLHPRANIDKMAAGQALDDNDRQPWLGRLSDVIYSLEQKNETGVLVCSALKKRYRERLRSGSRHVRFLWLHGDFEQVMARMCQRKGHFMPQALLQSQFSTLETPGPDEPDVLAVDITPPVESIVRQCVHQLR
ncbi:gluconokinase [Shimwellia blattae]|uniref:Gluconokinase n=1 Tax=Shimwellia blattae (strain ATCC 29907 / DSM 4481 / JCM 1650 / NBRC 105725 / CDC 9005-74) TaxID=630626 RepID=I2B5P4_SHIBC|nr:gluconokinase [Shimwellia blattae]AFJ45848.1 thermosensitive gluconokinase [Shimwellia blattae DSM 4481 = NBRC 105725]GAB81609.1 thermosensitive gluconokinase [Shimwellia blattae DSM 4481 = NBRC 105725]VDY63327.1 Thermoresistant gluconokinase [Shimwellia blattae]VEC21111.1 Thermoresistant gluconokinase [Shimwellia blattae]